jgi:hypothetical protein
VSRWTNKPGKPSEGTYECTLYGTEVVQTTPDMTEAAKQLRRANEQPLTEHSLARLLKPFSLFPKKIRQGRNLFRGYVPLKVLEAAERYVEEEPEEVEEEVEEE